jgi:hypothetical protein
MSDNISNIISENRNKDSKLNADSMNSFVERITGLNPVNAFNNGKPSSESSLSEDSTPVFPGISSLPIQGPTRTIDLNHVTISQLIEKVEKLERKLAKYEYFGGADSDVIMNTKTPAHLLNRGADATAMSSGIIRKKNAKKKDPVDGVPDGQKQKANGESMMNILGMSMNEWRDMAGLKAPLTSNPAPLTESYEDEGEYEDEQENASARQPAKEKTLEHRQWAEFLTAYDSTPGEFRAFVEAADRAGDQEAMLAVHRIEDEFIESISVKSNINELWSQWLEDRGLSVVMFDNLVENIQTENDLAILRSLQMMFEAEIAGATRIAGVSPTPGEKELAIPGKPSLKLQSIANGQVKPSRKGNFSLPASMRAKMGLSREEDEAFECDDDGNGHPDMKHPGWSKALKKFNKNSKKD